MKELIMEITITIIIGLFIGCLLIAGLINEPKGHYEKEMETNDIHYVWIEEK